MAQIVKDDEPFERIEMDRARGARPFAATWGRRSRSSTSKRGWPTSRPLSFYRQGEFIDLCRGPHVPSAGAIGAFKLLSVAGAYWKGDASRQQLQRLYGTAWFSKQDLEEHLQQCRRSQAPRPSRAGQAARTVHSIDPLVGSGLILWLPKGAVVRRELENFSTTN